MKKRIIAAFMAAVMCLSSTSCSGGGSPSTTPQWSITEEELEQVVELPCKAEKNGDMLEVTLTCEEDFFKEGIEKKNIVVQAFNYQPKEQEETESSESTAEVSPSAEEPTDEQITVESSFSDPSEITDYTLTRTDGKTL